MYTFNYECLYLGRNQGQGLISQDKNDIVHRLDFYFDLCDLAKGWTEVLRMIIGRQYLPLPV